MSLKRIFSSEFFKCFSGKTILRQDIENKLATKHKVYSDDLIDALGDPLIVVMKPKQKSPAPLDVEKSRGKVYELLGETESGQIMFIVGRLFPDGNLYIITAYWANSELIKIYHQEGEAMQHD